MKWDEFLRQNKEEQRKKAPHKSNEHNIQVACINWFRLAYGDYRFNLIAIPNGGRRDAKTGASLKEEGVIAGTADLQLIVPCPPLHGLFIEMKTPKGRQQETQKRFQYYVQKQGYAYEIIRSLDEFRKLINSWIKGEYGERKKDAPASCEV